MTEAPSVQAAHLSAMQSGRPNYAKRSAESQAAFFLPHLRSGMELLDVGCGPGSITIGLAERVAPGRTIGFDQVPGLPAESPTTALVTGDAYDLPFRTAVSTRSSLALCSSTSVIHSPSWSRLEEWPVPAP